ncbi:MAG: hypothetical protein KDF58_07380 [Alphaproteobacteria bacterium]|nr:hypothetical protein [Alphaproteobacteria bacterium]HPF45438.1 hypothetical protein [Emcibacteraceae bacterium]
MANIKRLHKIIQEMGSDPNVSMHELVREVLKRDHDFDDYYLENISDTVSEEDKHEYANRGRAFSEDIRITQAKIKEFLEQDKNSAKMALRDRESLRFETIERLQNKPKPGWTDVVESAGDPEDNSDE